MKISSKQLRSLIREEYLRSTPVTRRGQMMSEARANMLAEQMIEEGLFDSIKAGFAAFKAGASKTAEKMGDAAGKALEPAAKAAQAMAGQAKAAYDNVSKAVSAIKDETMKAAAEAAKKSLEDSLKSTLQKALADSVANLTKSGMEEKEAQTLAATIANGVIGNIAGKG